MPTRFGLPRTLLERRDAVHGILRDTAPTMAQQESEVVRSNVEVVRGLCQAWSDADVERALLAVDPDVVWEAITDAPDAGTYRGHAGVRRYMEDWIGDFDITEFDVQPLGAEGDRLVLAQRVRAAGKGSGAETELRYAVAYWFRDGRLVEIREFRTEAEALAAADIGE
jgi:ketosteroid isomerase-like protein